MQQFMMLPNDMPEDASYLSSKNDLEAWNKNLREVALFIGKLVVLVFLNVNKYYQEVQPGRQPLSFNSAMLPIMYMMQTGYRIPVRVGTSNTDGMGSQPITSMRCVSVVPKIPITAFLPEARTKAVQRPVGANGRPAVEDLCNATSGRYSTPYRAMNTMQTDIRERFDAIGNGGHLFDVEINLLEVFAKKTV